MLMDEVLADGPLDWLFPRADSMGDFAFFRVILSYLRNAIADFGIGLMGRSMQWVGGIALTLLTLWIVIQGYRIVTGQSRNSMMALVTNSLRAVLVLTAATTMAMFGSDLHEFLNQDVRDAIHHVVAGGDESPEDSIDRSLAWMQVAFSSIDSLDVMGDPVLDREKTQALWFVGMGTGGPAMTAGTLLLLYEIAMALFIGLGPLFILCLLFEQTKPLFEKWLLYGIGTMFSMAVLSAMVSIALEMVVRVVAAFWGTALAGSLLGSDFTDGMTSAAIQQGGLGLILTLLIFSTPPMAAAFFNGALGQFMPFSAFAGGASRRNASGGGGYIGSSLETSQEFHPVQPQWRQDSSPEVNPDQVKRLAGTESNDFLKRYPNALASTEWIGGRGDQVTLAVSDQWKGRNSSFSPPVDSELVDGPTAPPWVLERIDRANLHVWSGQVTFNAEGNDDPASPYYSRQLHWPGGASGVTLSRGYDMRHRTHDQVVNDLLTAGATAESAERFAGAAGLSGAAARDFVRLHQDEYGEISRRVQRRLFEDFVYPDYVAAAHAQYTAAVRPIDGAPSWESLDSRVRDIAVDQQGQVYRRQLPYVALNDRESFARYIETTPELSQYESGRGRAAYLRGAE